jgi:hypothetical protein
MPPGRDAAGEPVCELLKFGIWNYAVDAAVIGGQGRGGVIAAEEDFQRATAAG